MDSNAGYKSMSFDLINGTKKSNLHHLLLLALGLSCCVPLGTALAALLPMMCVLLLLLVVPLVHRLIIIIVVVLLLLAVVTEKRESGISR